MAVDVSTSHRAGAWKGREAATRFVAPIALVLALAGCDDETSLGHEGPPPPPRSEVELLAALGAACRARDVAALEPLFHESFTYHESSPDELMWWLCRDRWLCLHRNLFDPQHAEPPTTPEWQLARLGFTANPIAPFEESPEYYASAGNPRGFDAEHWRVASGEVELELTFDLQGELDFRVRQRSNFVVIEDRAKRAGEPGKFTFHAIELVSVPRKSEEAPTWAGLLAILGGICDGCPAPPAASAVVADVAAAYASMDPDAFAALLHPDFVFSPTPIPNRPWGRAYEVRVHRRMFRPDEPVPGDPPVPANLHIRRIEISLAIPNTLVANSPSAPQAPAFTLVVPRRPWFVSVQASVFLETQGPTHYQVNSLQWWMLGERPGAPNSLCIYNWYETPGPPIPRHAAAVEPISWQALRRLYDGN